MNRKLTSIVIIFFLVIGGFNVFMNFESENVQGIPVIGSITTDTIWNLAGSPYIVIGDVWVEIGVTLTIEPGVDVKFDGSYSIYANGTIMAIGTAINRINITSNQAMPARSDWKNIQINSNGHGEIIHCEISYGTSGIYLDSSSNNNITNNIILYNSEGIYLDLSSNNNLTGNIISNNLEGIEVWGSSSNIILNNNISSNLGHGIRFRKSSNNTIIDNNISKNGETGDVGVGIYLSSSSNITIINNNFINDGVFISGDQLSHFNTHTIPDNNMVNGKPLYYYKDSSGINIDGIPVGQLILANCTDIEVQNLQINKTEVGIEVAYSTNISITNNNISWNRALGIYLYQSSKSTIRNNNVSSIRRSGISLEWSSNNSITNNNVKSCSTGIFLDYSSNDNTITSNTVLSMVYEGIIADDASNHNIISNNIVTNNTVGIKLLSSSNNTVNRNNVSNNDYGIILSSSSFENVITWNTLLSNNYYGIFLWSSSDKNIIDNNSIFNSDFGFIIESSNSNIITGNTITNNSNGIYFETSSNNRIYHNNIINNVIQAFDDMNNNIWNDSYPSGGNYWSDFDEPGEGAYDDFNGPDQDLGGEDGIVDNGTGGGGGKNPYVIDSDSQDVYPLINSVDTFPPTITNLLPYDGSTTNDNTPTISADYNDQSGINVSSVLLKVDGIDVTFSAIVTASGVSFIPGTVLSEGIHTIYLEVRDIVDNLATVTWNFTVDTTPPVIANLQPPSLSIMNITTPTISADYSDLSGINASSVVLMVDGIDVTLSAIVTIGVVNYIHGTALSDGVHTVYLEVRDNVGNLATVMWNFTVDSTAPIITNLQPIDSSTINNNTPLISADYNDPSGINESSVLLEVDGIDVTSSAMVTTNYVTYLPGIGLLDNVHTLYFQVEDIVGNLATVSWTFTVDTTPPIITNLQPPDASTTNNFIPTISADYSDLSGINVSSVMIEVDGIDITSSAIVTANGMSYIPGVALSEGIHTIYLEVGDNVGNLATANWSFTVDSNPPIITNLQPPDASTINVSNPSISADYSDLSGINVSSVALEVDGVDMTSSAVIIASGVIYIPGGALSDGIHTIYLEIRDNVGNPATASWSFTVDTTPPTITNLQPPDSSATNDNIPTISADYSDTGGINSSSITLEIDGIEVTSSATVTVDGASYTPGTELVDGMHTIYLEVEDAWGNLATVSWSFEVDTTSPTISNLQPYDVSTINEVTPSIGADYNDISGIDVNNIVLMVDGIDITSLATVTAGGVSYTPESELAEGQHTVYLEVRDIYGNQATSSWSFYVDYPPLIEAREPGGTPGQTYTLEDVITITWIANDGNSLPVNPINITFGDSINGWTIVAVDEPNDGMYTWEITDVPTGTYWVNISVFDSFGQTRFDMGNYSFVINIPVTYPPEIADVKADPDPQTVGKEVTLSATVSDPDTDIEDLIVKINIIDPDGTPLGNFTMTYNSTLGKYTYKTYYDSKGSYTFVIWASDQDGNWASIDSTFFMEPKKEEQDYNWKPIIALIFTIILLILGILISLKRPLKFKGELEKDRWYTFLIAVLPFAVAESATGVISLFTGLLRVPPILGVGMIVDLIILIGGILSSVVIFRKWSLQDIDTVRGSF
jgi:parallel beta-helix repeat protein